MRSLVPLAGACVTPTLRSCVEEMVGIKRALSFINVSFIVATLGGGVEASAATVVDVEQHLVLLALCLLRVAKSAMQHARGSLCATLCGCNRALRLPCATLDECSDRILLTAAAARVYTQPGSGSDARKYGSNQI